MLKRLFLVSFCLIQALKPYAQTQDSLVMLGIDTTALYDSILTELKLLGFVSPDKKSFVDINAGFGNGSFALQNSNYEVNTNHLFFNTGVGYYHKSGLSLSSGLNMTSDQGKFSLYQFYISPAYDFQNKSVAFGFAGFKYFNKQDLRFYISPLVNELYGYLVYKKSWLQPKLAIDYGWGTYDELANLQYIDTVKYRRMAPLVRYLSNQERLAAVSDFSLLFSLRHDFIWHGGKEKRNMLRYTPSITVLAGTSKYGTNTPLNSINGPRMSNLTEVRLFDGANENLLAPPPATFKFQNFNITQSLLYSMGKTYLQGQLVFSYILPKEQSRWNVFYNIGAGISL